MWPFRRKLRVPYSPVQDQLSIAVKSLSLPEATPTWSLFAKKQDKWDQRVAIEEGYNASAIVYAAVEKRAKLIASVPWRAMRNTNGELEHAPNSPLQKLLDSPNPDYSLYELMYEVSQSLDLAGNAFLSEIKGGASGQPFEVWPLPARFIGIKPGRTRLVDYYEYDEAGVKRRIDAEDMVQLKMPNPNSRWFGQPVLMAAGRATDIDRESGDWQKVSLQNRGVLDIAVKLPEGTTPEQAEAAKRKFDERQTGPKNARRSMFTTGDIKQLGQTAAEMDFVESRKAVWTEIAAVFGVPLAALGFTEDVNLANAEAMMKSLWQDTIIPQLELLQRQLTHQLAKDFGPEWEIVPDLSNVEALQEGFDEKLGNAERLMRLGYTRNEVNQRLELGFEDDPAGDIRYEPVGMLPIVEGGGDGGEDGIQDDEDLSPEEKRILARLTYG